MKPPKKTRSVKLSDETWAWLKARHPRGAAKAIEAWHQQEKDLGVLVVLKDGTGTYRVSFKPADQTSTIHIH